MNSDPNQSEKPDSLPAGPHSKDITAALEGWDYESGTIGIRKITGLDGRPKLQMRLDLGLLQMELQGRPDGKRPHDFESLLDYYEHLRAQADADGEKAGKFRLTREQCQSLREEAVQYYHRYLSLFVLEDFEGVVRDTDRNLRVLDLCGKYAQKQGDRLMLEQYRPYIMMMNIRGRASILARSEQYDKAIQLVREGLAELKAFFTRFDQHEAYAHSSEVRILKKLARDIRRKIPVDPIRRLEHQLNRAVQDERYEEAARLRDEIRARHKTSRA